MRLGPGPRTRGLRAAAAIAAVQGAAFLAYAGYVLVEALRVGVTGPAEVSNVPAIVVEIALFAFFAAGLLLTAVGLWRCRRWARAPFVLAQLFGLVVGVPLVQAAGSVERAAGAVLLAVALVGLVLAFTPAVSTELEAPTTQDGPRS